MKGEVLDPDGDKVRHVDVPISFRDLIFFWSVEAWMGTITVNSSASYSLEHD
jgi:hypothetical protein